MLALATTSDTVFMCFFFDLARDLILPQSHHGIHC